MGWAARNRLKPAAKTALSLVRDYMGTVTAPRYRFVSRPAHDDTDFRLLTPDTRQRRAIAHRDGPLLVQGGPGTGKTTTLIESVAARVNEGIRPRELLVLGFGRRGTAALRRQIAVRLGVDGEEVPTYSFAAFAFALLNLPGHAPRDGMPQRPQLLKGPEQDVIIRELLQAGTVEWPEPLQPALKTNAFSTQLRDLILRATERGVTAGELARLGREHGRPEWVSAARFLNHYVDVMSVRGNNIYDSAEIVRAAATRFGDDPQLMTAPRYVYVDELQDTDPAQWQLLRQLSSAGSTLVAFGDLGSAVFGFRGGDRSIMDHFGSWFTHADGSPASEIMLDHSHRAAQAPLVATRGIAARLRRVSTDHTLHAVDGVGAGEVTAVTLQTATQEANHIVSHLRKAHLLDGVPWSQMAVISRSPNEHLPSIARALTYAGVPTKVVGEDRPLSVQPIVANLLMLIQCALEPKQLDEETATTLLHSVYGRSDAILERRLRQHLKQVAAQTSMFRSTGELLVTALREPEEAMQLPNEPWALPAQRIAALMERARSRGTIEEVLWAVWDSTGLSDELARRAASGDPRAAGADDQLDAMMTLFEWAADFSDRLPGSDVGVFADHVMSQVIPADTIARHADRGDAVELLTAHHAKGRQWDLVVVAGVQEGRWPSLRPRGSLLGADFLVETLTRAGAADVDQISVQLDEERRLFYVACSRARDRLIVTAIADDDDNEPSRFLDELGIEVNAVTDVDRPMTLSGLVAELRTKACGDDQTLAAAAIAQLANLAAADVPGADPQSWWGLRPLSDDRPLALPGEHLKVNPSAVATMNQCGLRWMLERHGGNEPSGLAQQTGQLLHAAAERVASVEPDAQERMLAFIAEHAPQLPTAALWASDHIHTKLNTMAHKYLSWLGGNNRTLLATEKHFRVSLPPGDTGANLEMSGIVDRLEQSLTGGLHVVDLKTGSTATSYADTQRDLQLASYQLAVQNGAFRDIAPDMSSDGASLVYVGAGGERAAVRVQSASGDEAQEARDTVVEAAQAMTRSTFQAVHTGKCDSCAVRNCCPISGQGRAVTE